MRLTNHLIAFAALLPFFTSPSIADDSYPTRPVHLIVGFAPGSSVDVVGRIMAGALGKILGQTVIVENHAGATGMIATDYTSRATKDGYTIVLATVAATINTTLMPGKGVDFETGLDPIALVGSIPNILVVNPDLPVNSVKDLIALAKQKPGDLLYGASGLGSGPQLAAELFNQMAGVKMSPVFYQGSSQTVTDLIAGRIQVMFSPASTVLGFMKDGRVKALASTQAQRTSSAPDLPTIAETGIPGYDTGLWYGLLAPAGTPAPIVDKLSKATNDALKDPEVLTALHTQGLDALGGSPDQFRQYIKSETDRWARIIQALPKEQK